MNEENNNVENATEQVKTMPEQLYGQQEKAQNDGDAVSKNYGLEKLTDKELNDLVTTTLAKTGVALGHLQDDVQSA